MATTTPTAPAIAAAWPEADLGEAGFSPETGLLLDRLYAAGRLENLHAVVGVEAVLRDEELAAE